LKLASGRWSALAFTLILLGLAIISH